MSWARLGAMATRVDFSDAAIDLARSLNDELALNARFIRSDVYDLPDVLDEASPRCPECGEPGLRSPATLGIEP